MIENFSNVKELRSYIKSISLDRLNLLMTMAGVSDEEKQLVILRYKHKYSLTKVAYMKNTNIASVSRKCTLALKQIQTIYCLIKKQINNCKFYLYFYGMF